MQLKQKNFNYDFPLKPLVKSKVIYLILHHVAIQKAEPEDIHRWHRHKGFGGFGYNEYIRKDGSVVIGRGDQMGAHCKDQNAISYGICLEGNYDREISMPKEQMDSLIQRIVRVKQQYPVIRSIHRHSDFRATACPGRYFPFEEVLVRVKQQTNDLDIEKTEMTSAIQILAEQGIITDRAYWQTRAFSGESIRGDYAGILIRRMAQFLRK